MSSTRRGALSSPARPRWLLLNPSLRCQPIPSQTNMFQAEHVALPFIPCCDSFDGLILAFCRRTCMSSRPVNGRKQFQTVRRLETFNQTIDARQPLVFGAMVGQKSLSFLCGPFQQFNFHVRLLSVSVAAGVMPLQGFQHLVEIRRVWTVMPGLVFQSQRLSSFLQKVCEFLDLQERQPVGLRR